MGTCLSTVGHARLTWADLPLGCGELVGNSTVAEEVSVGKEEEEEGLNEGEVVSMGL